jgi:hypothetical protein
MTRRLVKDGRVAANAFIEDSNRTIQLVARKHKIKEEELAE